MVIIQDIKPRGNDSAYVALPFDEAKAELEQAGYQIISLEQNVGLRIQEGKDAFVSKNGNWTREGVLYVPNKGAFLTKKSPIMLNAKEATSCHRNVKEFYLTNNQVEEALADSVALSSASIPTNRFKDEERTVYAFGKIAEAYGQFLREAGIKEMPIWLANVSDKAFARQMWLYRLVDGGRSDLNGLIRYLDGTYGVRGIVLSGQPILK